MTRIAEIADEFVVRFCALHPVAATALGVPGHDAEWDDFSSLGSERGAALARETITALEGAEVEDDRDRIARDALLARLRSQLEMHAAGEEFRALNILASPLQRIRGVFDLMPRDSEEAWRNISARLHALPEALAQYRATLNEGIERGLTSTRRQARECALQSEVWSGQRDGQPAYFTMAVGAFEQAGSPGGEALRRELEQGAQLAIDAYADAGRWLSEHYVPRAEEHDPVGPDRYPPRAQPIPRHRHRPRRDVRVGLERAAAHRA